MPGQAPRTDWLYERFQATGRIQNRYLLLLLLTFTYTLAAHYTRGDTVSVPFLGLAVPRDLVDPFAVLVLSVLMLAFFGAGEATVRTHLKLAQDLDVAPEKLTAELMDQNPNLLDCLQFSTYYRGEPTPFTTVIGWVVLYPLPLVGVLVWTIHLWWVGFHAQGPCSPPWLLYLHLLSAAVLLWTTIRTVMFLWMHVWFIATYAAKRRANARGGR